MHVIGKMISGALGEYRRRIQEQTVCRDWIKSGRPLPPPHPVKVRIIRAISKEYGLRVFVETGTFRGDMVFAMRKAFSRIYSIELGFELYNVAKTRMAPWRHVEIMHGDSGERLGEVMSILDQPCLFWLDGHYSAGRTAKGEVETPIRKELDHIAQHSLRSDHVVLIDDARDFTGDGDYPSLNYLRNWAREASFETFEIEDNIIRMHSKSRSSLDLT